MKATTIPSEGIDAELRQTLERMLEQAMGRPAAVRAVRRERSPFATVASAEILSLSLDGGRQLSMFLKHLGPEQADHPDKQCREREPRVYQELFCEDLPVVRCFGSRWNRRTRRRELYLQYVDDWNLTCHHLEHWFTAARRLAGLHAHFASHAGRLRACDFLLRIDVPYLRAWAGRALAAVRERSAALAAELAPVVDRYEPAAELIARQPATLVHNDLAPKNVLADRSVDPARIYFVDWEMAGIGCGVLDLVHLKYGLGPEDDQRMCDAYCDGLARAGLLPNAPEERDALFAACELHRTLYRLAHVTAWRLGLETAAQWVGEARELLRRSVPR